MLNVVNTFSSTYCIVLTIDLIHQILISVTVLLQVRLLRLLAFCLTVAVDRIYDFVRIRR